MGNGNLFLLYIMDSNPTHWHKFSARKGGGVWMRIEVGMEEGDMDGAGYG